MTFDGGGTFDGPEPYDAAGLVDPTGTGTVYVTETTARVWLGLPSCYRDADATASGQGDSATEVNFPLLRWLAAMVDQGGEVGEIIDACSDPTSAALTDPTTAEQAWLPWLASLVGISLTTPIPDVQGARTAIANAITGSPRGSKGAFVAAVQGVLTGTQNVTVVDHYQGDPWQIEVATLASETPATLSGWDRFTWGVSEWGATASIWNSLDPIEWYLQSQGQVAPGFTVVHTES